jgi:putative ABC transport system ATP-binding protein
MTAPVAELRSVSRTYQVQGSAVPVLRDLDLTIHSGDRIVIFGPSGCGKTTLLHLLALLDEGTTGSYSLLGHNLWPLPEKERARIRAEQIGLIFQRFHLLPYHTVTENIRLRGRYLPEAVDDGKERLTQLLDGMGLTPVANRPVRLLSGGEQQRVCIARACYLPPRLLLADEPTGNLDEENSNRVQALLRTVARNTPVVVATHDPFWIPFATRVLRLTQGTLTEEQP